MVRDSCVCLIFLLCFGSARLDCFVFVCMCVIIRCVLAVTQRFFHRHRRCRCRALSFVFVDSFATVYISSTRDIVVVVTSRMFFFRIVHIIFLVGFFFFGCTGDGVAAHKQKHSKHKQKSISCTTAKLSSGYYYRCLSHQIEWFGWNKRRKKCGENEKGDIIHDVMHGWWETGRDRSSATTERKKKHSKLELNFRKICGSS